MSAQPEWPAVEPPEKTARIEVAAQHVDLLAKRDALISRCTCGTWMWRGHCTTCT